MVPPSRICQNRRNTGELVEGRVVWRRCYRGALCSLKDLRTLPETFTSMRWIDVCYECEKDIGNYNVEALT